MAITLYRARFSTNVERVAITLALKGLTDVESVWISYADRSAVERVSGQALVPVLDYDGEILVDSMDIVRELDRRHPEPPLFAERPFDVLTFIDWFNSTWKRPPNRIEEELGKEAPDEELIAELGAEMIRHLDRFEAMLSESRYMLGDALSAADICAYPFLKYAVFHDPADDELFHRILRDRQRDGRERPRLAAWVSSVRALPQV